MATTTGLSPAQVQAQIIAALAAHRNALNVLQNLYRWSSGITATDMATAAGLSPDDAQTYMSAIADANAEANTHYTGQPGGAYPAPVSDYPYAATQSQVIGPQ